MSKLQQSILFKENKCVADCAESEYPDVNRRACKLCHINCKSCLDESSNGCTSCKLPLYHQSGEGKSNCLETCPVDRFKYDYKCLIICPLNLWGRQQDSSCNSACSLSTEFKDPVREYVRSVRNLV